MTTPVVGKGLFFGLWPGFGLVLVSLSSVFALGVGLVLALLFVWLFSGFSLAWYWLCSGFALVLLWVCSVFALSLLCLCSGFALALLWLCSGFALALLWLFSRQRGLGFGLTYCLI